MSNEVRDVAQVPTVEEIREIEDSRDRLIAAGARLILDEGLAALANGISPDKVTRLAGRTRRVFYDHFATKEDFVQAICDYYLADGPLGRQHPGANDLVAEMVAQTQGNLVKSLEQITTFAFERGANSQGDILRTVTGALANDPETRQVMADRMARMEFTLASLISSLIEHWGLKLREPWTTEQLACVLYSLAEGLFRRSRAGSDSANAETFALSALTLLPIVTQRPGEPPSTVFNQLERLSHQVSATWRERSIPGETTNARERVIDAFRAVISDNGPTNATIEEVSQRSGVSEETVVAAFGDIYGVLAAALQDAMPSLQAEAEFDLTSDAISIEEAIRRHLLRAGHWIVENPMLINTVVVLGATGPNGIVTDATIEMLGTFAKPMLHLLTEGQQRGIFREDAQIIEAASMATEVMLGRGGAMPGFDPDANADLMTDWIMRGLT